MKRLKTATVLIASLAIGLLIPIGTLGTTGTASMPIAQAATGDQEKKGGIPGASFTYSDNVLTLTGNGEELSSRSILSQVEKALNINLGQSFTVDRVVLKGDLRTGEAATKLFANMKNITGLEHLTTTGTKYMNDMFQGVSGPLDVSHLDTSSVIDMSEMFTGSTVTSLDLSNFDTKNVAYFSMMFYDMPALTTLDISSFSMRPSMEAGDGVNEGFPFTSNMFAMNKFLSLGAVSDSLLSTLILGPNVRFFVGPDIADNTYKETLEDPPTNGTYTGKWIAKGSNTPLSSDDLVNLYANGLTSYPTGEKQTYVWQTVSKPITNPTPDPTPIPTPTPDPTPTTKPKKPVQPQVLGSISAVKKIGLYRQANFSKKTLIRWYAKQPRNRRPQFVIIAKTTSKAGVARYRVRDVTQNSDTYGLEGYITTKTKYLNSAYYSVKNSTRRFSVLNPKGVNGYRKSNLKGKTHHYRQGQKLKVKRVVTYKYTTRLQLTNGQYVTANKKLVQTSH